MLKIIAPPLLESANTDIGAGSMFGIPMHFKFEVKLITNEIVGPPPEVKILRIAWYSKRQHVSQFLIDFYAAHKCLPRGCHDLGVATNNLRVGVIDFDATKQSLRADLQKKERRNAWALENGNLVYAYEMLKEIAAATTVRLYERYLSSRFYYRGQWFTRRKWHRNHTQNL